MASCALALAAASVRATPPTPTSAVGALQRPLPFGTAAFDIPRVDVRVDVSPQQIELLDAAIAAGVGPERVAYVALVGQCGTAGLPLLHKYVADPDAAVRGECARTAAALKDPSIGNLLATLAGDRDPSVRREAVLAAAKHGQIDVVTRALDDPDADVRRVALRGATTPDQAGHIDGMLATLPADVKVDAVRALGRIEPAKHVQVLAAQSNGDIATKIAAIESIGESRVSSQAEAIRTLLNDQSPVVRRTAVVALGKLASPPQQQHIAEVALADLDPGVRAAAADLLRAHPTPRMLEALSRQLDDEDAALHESARQALAALGPAVISTAEAMLGDAKPQRRIDGSYLLGFHRSAASLDRHIALLADADWTVALQAAKSLSEIRPPADVVGPKVIALLGRVDAFGDPPALQSEAAATAILLAGRVGYRPVLEKLGALVPAAFGQVNAPESMREAAIWTIGVLALPDSPVARAVADVAHNSFQTPAAIFESLKARINMNDRSAKALFDAWQSDPVVSQLETCRWIAHWGSDHFNGTQTPFTPAARKKAVDLPVRPVSEATERP